MTGARVVLAPDSFKGSATAAEAARAIAAGWRAVRPQDTLDLRPMADGGEGTLAAFAAAVPEARRMPVVVRGPTDRDVATEWLLLPDGLAVVELAATSGITLLDTPRPLDAHTYGLGQAIADALRHGVRGLLLALGGSSSTDGGAGMLLALGARVEDSHGAPIPPGAAGLEVVARVDLSSMAALPPLGATVLSDVTNPLLGPMGAAAVFGPQKGADQATIARLDAALARFAALVPVDPATAGAGAAGGTAFGLLAWGARVESGAAAVGERIGLPCAVAHADIVVTGEGRFDSQSAAGKAPSYVLGLATEYGATAMLVAGLVDAPTAAFAATTSLTDLAGDVAAARTHAPRWLEVAGAHLARACSQR